MYRIHNIRNITHTRKKENEILIKYINTFKKKTIILEKKNNYQHKKKKISKIMEHVEEQEMIAHRKQFVIWAGVFQIILLVLFSMCTQYGDSAIASTSKIVNGTVASVQSEVDHLYPFYQDVHVMIFIGFGFLMTFLKKYTFSSVGYNFLIAAFAIQWSMIVNGLVHAGYEGHLDAPISLSITTLITSDFAAGAVLISFGAVLGKTSPLQMLFVVIFELIVYAFNELIGAVIFGAVDMGGSIFVHTFGAYFGLALSRTISKGNKKGHSKNGSSYNSDTFAMIGTVFLWMYWPSFNGALATESQRKYSSRLTSIYILFPP